MGVLFEDDFLDDFGTWPSIGSQREPSAFKAWSGMMSSYSTERWRLYFESVRRGWDGGNAEPTDFFAWERQWAEANSLP